jgi:hypothetical protein
MAKSVCKGTPGTHQFAPKPADTHSKVVSKLSASVEKRLKSSCSLQALSASDTVQSIKVVSAVRGKREQEVMVEGMENMMGIFEVPVEEMKEAAGMEYFLTVMVAHTAGSTMMQTLNPWPRWEMHVVKAFEDAGAISVSGITHPAKMPLTAAQLVSPKFVNIARLAAAALCTKLGAGRASAAAGCAQQQAVKLLAGECQKQQWSDIVSAPGAGAAGAENPLLAAMGMGMAARPAPKGAPAAVKPPQGWTEKDLTMCHHIVFSLPTGGADGVLGAPSSMHTAVVCDAGDTHHTRVVNVASSALPRLEVLNWGGSGGGGPAVFSGGESAPGFASLQSAAGNLGGGGGGSGGGSGGGGASSSTSSGYLTSASAAFSNAVSGRSSSAASASSTASASANAMMKPNGDTSAFTTVVGGGAVVFACLFGWSEYQAHLQREKEKGGGYSSMGFSAGSSSASSTSSSELPAVSSAEPKGAYGGA